MRRVIFGVASSLDNYIARNDHSIDWLMWGEEAAAALKEFWQGIDTVLMGRKTYEVAPSSGSQAYPGVTTYVFSRTLKRIAQGDARLVSEDVAAFVRELKHAEGKDIFLMGGGDFARSLFEAGLVDEIVLNIHPVLLGSGIPLFRELDRQIDLELVDCKPFRNGCVLVSYRVRTKP